MSELQLPVKLKTCNCVEIGIATDGIIFALMKIQDKRWEGVHAVEKCPHWQESYITILAHEQGKDTLKAGDAA